MASYPQLTEYPRMLDAFDTLAKKPYTRIVSSTVAIPLLGIKQGSSWRWLRPSGRSISDEHR